MTSPLTPGELSDEDVGKRLSKLLALLSQHEPAQWFQIEELLHDFPGWLAYVQRIQNPPPIAGVLPFVQGSQARLTVEDWNAKLLRSFFAPYALLLDSEKTNQEKLDSLEADLHLDVEDFCSTCFENRSGSVQSAARDLLEAYQQRQSLLRPSGSDAGAASLPRAASKSHSDEDLLHGSDRPGAATEHEPASWWGRLFHRGSGK